MAQATDRLPNAPAETVSFSWNGKTVNGRAGDTVAAALYGAGYRAFTRSRKFHEWRGLSGSFLAGHLGAIDGMPHCRLDRIAAREGMAVAMENVWPGPRVDLMALARLLPRRMLRAGFEHTRLVPDSSWMWPRWERFLAHMAGEAEPPPRDGAGVVAGRRIEAHTLIVGGGPAAREAVQGAQGPVVLVTRSETPGDSARNAGAELAPIPDHVTVLAAHDVYALYDGGHLAAAAPFAADQPVVLIDAKEVVLATGVKSVPPLVPGAALPGVLDAATALSLASRHGVAPGRRIVVVGNKRGEVVAERLEALGCTIQGFHDVSRVARIDGRDCVASIVVGGARIACDAVVHAGPWRADPSLPFQAAADGELRLLGEAMPDHVRAVGAAAEQSEAVSFGHALERSALVCPCMDVTVDEVLDQIAAGVTHIEELKRRTTCGMGTCQGVPCWDNLAAVVADATGSSVEDVGHPTYRPPRAALTFGQAAGLVEVTEVEP